MELRFKECVKLGVDFFKYCYLILKLKECRSDNCCFIFGTPVHENLGDHLIAYSEIKYLEEIGFTRKNKIIEVPIEAYKIFREELQKYVSRDSKIFINGGGWMGNVWPDDEKLLEHMIKRFPNNKIVIFPQSIYYDKKLDNCDEVLEESIETFRNRYNVVLCLREEKSYCLAKQYYPSLKICLIPDITLFLKGKIDLKVNDRKRTLGICIRDDREKGNNGTIIKEYISYFKKSNYKIVNVSTISKFRVPLFMRKYKLNKLFRMYSECSIVITDRLHGMIFAFLTNTPCIVFDNVTGKILGVYNKWLKKSKKVYLFENLCNIDIKKIITDYQKQETKLENLLDIQFDFSSLERLIYYGKN